LPSCAVACRLFVSSGSSSGVIAPETWASLQLDLAVVGGFCLLTILAAAAALRRRVA
jgi:hypothetical protein